MREINISIDRVETARFALGMAWIVVFLAVLHLLQMNTQIGWLDEMTAQLDAQNAELKASGEAMEARLGTLFGETRQSVGPFAQNEAPASVKKKEPVVVLLLSTHGTFSNGQMNSELGLGGAGGNFIAISPSEFEEIEAKLKAEGLFHGTPDGFMDNRTKNAVSAFQRKYHLKNQDGMLDTVTLSNLGFAWLIDRAMIQ